MAFRTRQSLALAAAPLLLLFATTARAQPPAAPGATKAFTDDPAPPGGLVTLEFTITNFNRDEPGTNIAFTDDLDAVLPGLAAVGLPANDVCGTGSQIAGTGLLTFTGGNLPPEGVCTFQVTLQVPAAALPGTYPNTTSTITSDVGGVPMSRPPATDDLTVEPAPVLTKSFTDDPTTAGGTVTLELTVTNTDPAAGATAISFTDDLGAALSGLAAVGLPANDVCGAGSTLSGTGVLTLAGGNLPAGGSCTFQVTLQVPAGAAAGVYTNTTSAVSGTVGGVVYQGQPASDDLVVVAAPLLAKTFIDDPAVPGGLAILELTLSYDESAPAGATGIAFTDDLGAVLPGLTAIGLPLVDVCGPGSQISGTTLLSFSGGSLAGPAESCSFQVTLQVPAGAVTGSYPNTTSDVTATSLGLAVTGPPATDDLGIVELVLTKQFTDDPVIAGSAVTLEFTVENLSAVSSATGLTFTDDLAAVLAGLTAVGLPANDVCGPGSQIAGTTLLTLTGGNLAAGASCTFQVTLQVPAGTLAGEYPNSTSELAGDLGGSPVTSPGATDSLTVVDVLSLTKEFTDDPVPPGGIVTLEFTLANADPAQAASGITFIDDLDAALSGLAAIGLPANDVCGAGSQISGTGLLTLTGGNLPAGGSCAFQVSLQVPAGVPVGASAINITSSVAGTVGGESVAGAPASDVLRIERVDFAKAFDGPSTGGGNPVLTFTLENLDAVNPISGLSFLDDLDAVLLGLVAIGLPAGDVCGAGSQISGTSVLTLTSGNLAPGASCSFDVTLQVPAGTAPGIYPNATSTLSAGGIEVADPATADLGIEPPPTFAKAFAPDSIGVGGISTLTFVIDNSASAVAAAALDFTDNLPAGVAVATPANAATTCAGGTITAVPGTGVIAYTGGSVAAGATCTVQAEVTATAPGNHVNVTGDLTSSSGNSSSATDTLTANPQPGFAKGFAPDPIAPSGVSTLTFTIDHSASTVDATGLDFTDVLPAAITVAAPANASTTCTGGVLTAVAGTGVISYTGGSVAAGATCTVQADVTATAPGNHVNLTGELTSSLGSSGTATDTLTVVSGIVSLAKSFLSAPVLRGGTVELEFTIANVSPDFPLTAIAFSDDLGAALPGLVALGLPAADVCGAGSQLTGTSVVSLAGGSLPPSGSCTFAVTLLLPTGAPLGVFTNSTGTLTASASGAPVDAPPATADLEVVFLDFAKAFDPTSVAAGEEVTLTFTIANPDPVNPVGAIAFSDDLDAVQPGLAAIDTPMADVCGTGSLLDGTSFLTLTGGSLPPGGSCTFAVTLAVPPETLSGTITNLTSALTAEVAGAPVTGDPAGAAEATLDVTGSPLVIPTLRAPAMILLAAALALLALARLRRRG